MTAYRIVKKYIKGYGGQYSTERQYISPHTNDSQWQIIAEFQTFEDAENCVRRLRDNLEPGDEVIAIYS